ncbi:hypothetical protein DFP73DRAFT_597018 [Morchella snyderi]|nr:hypothetical protein DFP73DRAFT_597018 [Morchella snyderi]
MPSLLSPSVGASGNMSLAPQELSFRFTSLLTSSILLVSLRPFSVSLRVLLPRAHLHFVHTHTLDAPSDLRPSLIFCPQNIPSASAASRSTIIFPHHLSPPTSPHEPTPLTRPPPPCHHFVYTALQSSTLQLRWAVSIYDLAAAGAPMPTGKAQTTTQDAHAENKLLHLHF